MKTIKFSLFAVVAMAAVSCLDEATPENGSQVNPNLVEVALTAIGESDENTKAIFSGYPKIAWEGNEEISLLGTNTGNQKLTASGKGHQTTFTGYADKTDDVYYAVYPYDANVSLTTDGKLSNVTVPAVQTATAGSFDPKSYIAVAKSTDKENLYFKAVGAFIKFKLEDAENVKSVTMVSNDGANMACSATIVMNENGGVSHGSPYIDGTASSNVKMVGNFLTDKAYFMVVRPQPYTGGITVYIEYKDGTVLSRKGESALFESGKARNYIRNLNILKKADFKRVTDLHTLYNIGYDINVGGELVINKTNYPNAQLITKESSTKNLKNGVYFVDAEAGCTIGSGISDLIVIGRTEGTRTPLTRTSKSMLDATSNETDKLVLKNITDMGGISDHNFQLNKTDIFEKVIFEDCYLAIDNEKALLAYVNNDRKMTDITIKNCDLKISTKGFVTLSRNTAINRVDLQNNIIFAESQSVLCLVDYTGSNLTEIKTVNIDNNTFYNVIAPGSTQGYIRAKSVNALTVTDNLFYDCAGASYNSYIYNTSNTSVTTVTGNHNIDSGNEGNSKVYVVNGSAPAGVESPRYTNFDFPLTVSDTGLFIIDGTFQGDYYGATR